MALDFDGSGDRFTLGTPSDIGEDGHPATMVAWFYRDDSSGQDYIGSFSDTGGGTSFNGLRLRSNNWTEVTDWDGSSFDSARNTSGHSDATWHHGAGVWPSASSRIVYLDGSSASDSGAQSPSGRDTLVLGARVEGGSYTEYMDGKLAEFAVWSRALSSDEINQLALGYSPLFFPDGLVAYLPLLDSGQDLMGNSWTETGTPSESDHPPGIIYPTKAQVVALGGTVAASDQEPSLIGGKLVRSSTLLRHLVGA